MHCLAAMIYAQSRSSTQLSGHWWVSLWTKGQQISAGNFVWFIFLKQHAQPDRQSLKSSVKKCDCLAFKSRSQRKSLFPLHDYPKVDLLLLRLVVLIQICVDRPQTQDIQPPSCPHCGYRAAFSASAHKHSGSKSCLVSPCIHLTPLLFPPNHTLPWKISLKQLGRI